MPNDPTLVGRDDELAQLRSLIGNAARGRGGICLIEGEPGIGKTRLAAEAFDHAERLGVEVFAGAAEELDRRRPFGVIADCLGIGGLGGRRAHIAKLLGLRGPGQDDRSNALPGSPNELGIVEEILALIEELCGHQPVVVCVEDLQWSDPSTLVVLHRLGRYVAHLPLALVCTARPLPRPTELAQLVRSFAGRSVLRICLGPLGPPAVVALTTALVGAAPGSNLVRKVEGAGGNPLFLTELVAALQREHAISPNERGEMDASGVGLPSSLPITILHRLSFLSRRTLEVLRMASVLGSAFSFGDLCEMLGQPAASVVANVDEATRGGIIGDRDGRLVFSHDLVRECLYDAILPAIRARLHLDVASALDRADATSERVAEHLMRGASPDDRGAVDWLRRIALDTRGRAPAVAVDVLTRVLELTPDADPARDEVLAELAASLLWSGRVEEAESTCRHLLRRPHALVVDGPARVCLAQALWAKGHPEEVLPEIEAAAMSSQLSAAEQARLKAWASLARWQAGDLCGAEVAAEAARLAASASSDDLAWCLATAGLAAVVNRRGAFTRALLIIDEAIERADRSPDRLPHRFQLYAYRCQALIDLDRLDECREAVRTGRQLTHALGAAWTLPVYHWLSALGLFWAGKWDDALAEFEAGLALSEDVGARTATAACHSTRAVISVHRNDLTAAEAAVTAAEAQLAEGGRQFQYQWVSWARALVLEAAGLPDRGLALLSEAWEACVTAEFRCEYPTLAPDLVRLAIRQSAPATAERVTAEVEEFASREDLPRLRALALHCRGLVAQDAEVLLRSTEAYRSSPRPLPLAAALEDAGIHLGRAGRIEEAWRLLEEALTLYGDLDATRDVARVEGCFRSLGIRRGHRGRRGRPKSGWSSLTETELRIVGLIAEGLSNPEIADRLFIARGTVHTHVSHVLTKLNLSSRAAVAAQAGRRRSDHSIDR
ncbi:MAG TPA: AAA family ATPase [Actinomycetota bacterium]